MRAALSPMLGHLAARRATGALLRGNGTLYLRDGEIVHAESPVSPGLEVLLTLGGRLPAEGWREAVERAGARRQVARFLVDNGRLTRGELEVYHLGALYDAAFFALAPGSGPARFRSGLSHWLGPVRPVPAQDLQREVLRRRRLLEDLWPHPEVDTAPVFRNRRTALPAPTRRQRALLELADGTRTPADIARRLGRPAFHVLIDVRRLAAAGHIRTPEPGRESPSGAPEPPASPASPESGDVPVPYLHPSPVSAVRLPEVSTDPDIALLLRIRDALEARL
ncbi:transcriptional regulator [Streptomyces sp. S1A]|uniref:transcriptional regulator n=1 Tax=Streptomyces sp. ICN903 TaxID=2964654 RepID=UPI001EDB7F7B|nr:transcriptional regulator [Streptomyces sp. ICN903]MCG3039139.1 transcriptional regulator [Streptomyces sp. ICN903]